MNKIFKLYFLSFLVCNFIYSVDIKVAKAQESDFGNKDYFETFKAGISSKLTSAKKAAKEYEKELKKAAWVIGTAVAIATAFLIVKKKSLKSKEQKHILPGAKTPRYDQPIPTITTTITSTAQPNVEGSKRLISSSPVTESSWEKERYAQDFGDLEKELSEEKLSEKIKEKIQDIEFSTGEKSTLYRKLLVDKYNKLNPKNKLNVE